MQEDICWFKRIPLVTIHWISSNLKEGEDLIGDSKGITMGIRLSVRARTTCLEFVCSWKRKIFTNQGNHIDNRSILILTLRLEINSVRQSPHIAVFLSRSLTTLSSTGLRNSSLFSRTRPCRRRDCSSLRGLVLENKEEFRNPVLDKVVRLRERNTAITGDLSAE